MDFKYIIINDSLITALAAGYAGQRVRIYDLDNDLVIDENNNQFTAPVEDLLRCYLKQYPAPTFISIISFTQPTDMLVGDPDQTLVASSTGNPAPIVFVSSDITVATIVSGGTALHAVAPGMVSITASQVANGSYGAAANVTLTMYVLVVSIINFTQPADMVVGDPDQTLVASSNGNPAPITFASSDPTIATIVNGALHAVAAGTVNITASQAASTGYTAAADVTLSVTIT